MEWLYLTSADHYLIYASLKLKITKPPASHISVRSYKSYMTDCLLEDLHQVPWHEIFLTDNVNDMINEFNKKFLDVLVIHAPIKMEKIRNRRRCPFVDAFMT